MNEKRYYCLNCKQLRNKLNCSKCNESQSCRECRKCPKCQKELTGIFQRTFCTEPKSSNTNDLCSELLSIDLDEGGRITFHNQCHKHSITESTI
ncbi:hypothetical protein C2G38_1181096 [Gigaspora rosea]|uniref:Uncharacterized protein n=1 Tax=Gigaspora rosea TaxID=44941 RepID=A0A397W7J2_9GLOM|nr:hypothetical protein C2G38_1181096 [Gigaspora rosea]